MLGLSPVLINFLGYLGSGDPLYLLSNMESIGVGIQLPKTPFSHYPSMFIFIIGPLTLALFLVGYLGFLRKEKAFKEYFANYGMLFIIFTIYFLFQIITAWDFINIGPNPGTLRYVLPVVPLAALFAGIGLEYIMKEKDKPYVYLVLIAVVIVTFVFLSYTTDKLQMLSQKEYFKFVVVFILLGGVVCLSELKMNPKIFLVLVVALGVGFTLIDEKPMKLDPTRKTIQDVAEWWRANGYDQRVTLHNHNYFFFIIDVPDQHNHPDKYPALLISNLQKVPVGSIVLWDSHYNDRPEYNLDVKIDYFVDNPNFKFLQEFVSSDRRFVIYAFEKVQDF
jgi:drug/metabolite transporter superfamily protein YnfA